MTSNTTQQTYSYRKQSCVFATGSDHVVEVETSGGSAANKLLARGFFEYPRPAAQALLIVGRVAATRFWAPTTHGRSSPFGADPVVTTSESGLRFEAFSACGGVYACFNLDRAAFDGEIFHSGTTNVDLNPNFRAALGRIGANDPVRLDVGREHIAVRTMDGLAVEKQVPLPDRWLRGFAEVGFSVAGLRRSLSLSSTQANGLLQTVPQTNPASSFWVSPTRTGARLGTRPNSAALLTGGAERLQILRGIIPFMTELTAYGTQVRNPAVTSAGPTVWVSTIDGGQLSIALSPSTRRGFSGEGALLRLLTETQPDDVAGLLEQLDLAGHGRLGYDCAAGTWFRRDLPFDQGALAPRHRRLAGARKLQSGGHVSLDDGENQALVQSGANEYSVRLVEDQWRCTCPWWGKHQGDRGPCKHVLAVVLQANQV